MPAHPIVPHHPAAHIGPNAITRVAEVLLLRSPALRREVFARAALAAHLIHPPQEPVPEADVQRLHIALRDTLGPVAAAAIAQEAGERTACYLLQHRIPRPAQRLLRLLPARLACALLLKAIQRNAWTFAGSGRFSHEFPSRHGVVLRIEDNPLCRDLRSEDALCTFYAATFETLFRRLVHPASQVRETHCEARGDQACCFELRWDCPKTARSAGPSPDTRP